MPESEQAELDRLRRMEADLTEIVETGPVEMFRQAAPEIVSRMTQLVVDNPGQFALIIAGSMVATRAAMNIVRPRNAAEALALMVVLQVGLPVFGLHAIRKGWLKFKVRDEDGCLVPLEPGDAGAV